MATPLPPAEMLAPAGRVFRRRPHVPDLAAVVTAVWATQIPPGARTLRVVPDAALDLVLAGNRLVVAGPDTRAIREPADAGWVLGFQLAPGAIAHVLGAPPSVCVNGRPDITELWGSPGRRLLDQLTETTDRRTAAALVERAIAARLPGLEIDPVPGALRWVFGHGGRPDHRCLGLGERQLRRRCIAAFGYPTATLRRIVRFRRFMDAITSDRTSELALLAHQLGYSDQSHLTHEVGEFSGLTPHAIRTIAPRSAPTGAVA
jgi:Helix-turn-helix domain